MWLLARLVIPEERSTQWQSQFSSILKKPWKLLSVYNCTISFLKMNWILLERKKSLWLGILSYLKTNIDLIKDGSWVKYLILCVNLLWVTMNSSRSSTEKEKNNEIYYINNHGNNVTCRLNLYINQHNTFISG